MATASTARALALAFFVRRRRMLFGGWALDVYSGGRLYPGHQLGDVDVFSPDPCGDAEALARELVTTTLGGKSDVRVMSTRAVRPVLSVMVSSGVNSFTVADIFLVPPGIVLPSIRVSTLVVLPPEYELAHLYSALLHAHAHGQVDQFAARASRVDMLRHIVVGRQRSSRSEGPAGVPPALLPTTGEPTIVLRPGNAPHIATTPAGLRCTMKSLDAAGIPYVLHAPFLRSLAYGDWIASDVGCVFSVEGPLVACRDDPGRAVPAMRIAHLGHLAMLALALPQSVPGAGDEKSMLTELAEACTSRRAEPAASVDGVVLLLQPHDGASSLHVLAPDGIFWPWRRQQNQRDDEYQCHVLGQLYSCPLYDGRPRPSHTTPDSGPFFGPQM